MFCVERDLPELINLILASVFNHAQRFTALAVEATKVGPDDKCPVRVLALYTWVFNMYDFLTGRGSSILGVWAAQTPKIDDFRPPWHRSAGMIFGWTSCRDRGTLRIVVLRVVTLGLPAGAGLLE